MINETILLLVYFYDYELRNHRLLKHITRRGGYLQLDLLLYEPLQKIFSKVILYDYLKRMTKIGIKEVNEEIIALARKERPKYVLLPSRKYEIQQSTLETIRKEGSIVIGLFFDDEWRFDDYSKWLIPYRDYCVTNAMEAVPKYRELNARCILAIPIMGSVPLDRDWSNIEERYDVSFVGSRFYADREQWINKLKNRNIPFHVFGIGWGGFISFEEMIDIFGASKINLNFSKGLRNSIQIKGRVFQVCMAGGFLLTEYAPGIENYFEIDKEIVCFHNADEMIDKISYYLNHETERRAIAQAGWRRAIGEYTSFHMLSKIFRQIEEDLAKRGKENTPLPQKLKMPMRIRRIPAQYHLEWGKVLLEENYKGLWKDQLALSISYYPFSIRAWYYYIIGFFPYFLRLPLLNDSFKLCKFYMTVIRLYSRLRSKLLCWADSIPYLRNIKRSVAKRFYDT